jgi:hypothetical protein
MGRIADMRARFSPWGFGRLVSLSVAIAVAAWAVGYLYLVKIAGYPAAGFFSFKMVIGLLAVSVLACVTFRLRGFFTKTPR